MFPNLEAEMARSKLTQAKLSEVLGITQTTLSFKLNGKSTLSLKECVWRLRKRRFLTKRLIIYLKQKRKENEGSGCYKFI